jgi:hypothetical protein
MARRKDRGFFAKWLSTWWRHEYVHKKREDEK